MEGAGAFEADAKAMTEEGAVSGKHGGEHRSVVVSEAEEARETGVGWLIGEADNTLAGRLLDTMDPAGEAGVCFCHSNRYILDVSAAESADSLFTEPCCGIPYTGIEEALFGMHGGCSGEVLTAGELGEGRVGGRVESEAESFGCREILAVYGGDMEIDLLAVLVADDIGVRGVGVDEAEWRRANDGTFDDVSGFDARVADRRSRSGCREGNALQWRRHGRTRLDLSAEDPEEKAEDGPRDQGNANRGEGSYRSDRKEECKRSEEIAGGEPDSLSQCVAAGERDGNEESGCCEKWKEAGRRSRGLCCRTRASLSRNGERGGHCEWSPRVRSVEREMRDALQMVGLREEIQQMHISEAIAGFY
jgi:hypothetical protein